MSGHGAVQLLKGRHFCGPPGQGGEFYRGTARYIGLQALFNFSGMIRMVPSCGCTLCWLATVAEPVRIGVLAYRPGHKTLAQALKQAIPEQAGAEARRAQAGDSFPDQSRAGSATSKNWSPLAGSR